MYEAESVSVSTGRYWSVRNPVVMTAESCSDGWYEYPKPGIGMCGRNSRLLP